MKKLAVILLALAVIIGYKYLYPIFHSRDFVTSPQPSPHEEREETPKVFAGIVIDNAPEARPQYGLSQASVVFETVAEGGITRVLAFYKRDDAATRIGPVRSARPYFVDWVYGIGAALAHSGGSKEGLAKITSLGSAFRDINEFSAEHYFWRDRAKPSPHNLFTSIELLKKYFDAKKWDTDGGQFGWNVNAVKDLSTTATSTSIFVDFSYPQFAAKYEYDTSQDIYLRSLGGKPALDALDKSQIKANNVVVLYTTSTIIDKNLLTIDLATSGFGRAVIFRSGKTFQARWRKTAASAPLELLDADGTRITLLPGQTWFEVIDQHGTALWE